MEDLITIGTVTLIHLLAVISPGPDFIVACKNTLTYSRKTGLWTAVGFGAGIAVHVFYCLMGLALLISKSIILFNFIKLIGAFYLIYIGYKSFTSKDSTINIGSTDKKTDITPFQAIRIGFLTNVLNPKATLFFLSLFTLIISPNTPKIILMIISLIMITNTILWFSFVAICLSQKRVRDTFEKYQGVFNKTLGGLLIMLGIKVAVTK